MLEEKIEDWKMEKELESLADAKKEQDRLLELVALKEKELADKKKEITEAFKNKENHVLDMATAFLNCVDTKKTKTQETYQLLSAKVVRTLPGKSIKPDKDLLIDLVPEFVKEKTTKSFDWAGYKKTLKVVGDKIINEDGEVVEIDGLELEDNPVEVKIKF